MSLASAYGKSDDTRLADLAARQHGVVATTQLRDLGYSYHAIHTRVASGRLHRLMRGVYAAGHTRISLRARWMAAVLACGPGAVLSHRAAATLWELRATPSGPIDVTAPSRHNIPGIRCHWVRSLHADDVTVIDGIPVTSLSRTLLDLAEILGPQQLRTSIEAAQRRDLLSIDALDAVIARNPGRHGLKPLRKALGELRDEAPWTQSELERGFLELIRAAGLPEPQTNVVVDGFVVDFFWPEHNLIVEVDGYRYHRTRRSFEDDRRRDAKHTVAGRRAVRVTRDRIVRGYRELLAELVRLLSAVPALPPGRSGR
jgi:very-short-patch-repair endonuclease